MADTSQLTAPSWAIAAFQNLDGLWRRILTAHSQNNGALVSMERSASQLADPVARARILAGVKASVARQVTITGAMRGLVSTIDNVRRSLKSALDSIGVPSSGLGVIPLIPVAIGLGIVAAAGVAASIMAAIHVQAGAIGNDAKILEAMRAGQISPEKAAELMAQNARNADKDTSALGLASIFKSALPLVLAIGAVLIAPRVLSMLDSRRRRAA